MEQRVRHVVFSVALLAALGALIAPAALARPETEEPAYTPPIAPGGPIGLLDSIRMTLEHQPTIRLQTEGTRYQQGLAREAKGAFDTSILGDFSYEYTQRELTKAEKDAEQQRRQDYLDEASKAGASARDNEVLRDSIDRRLTSDDDCRANGTCNACTRPAPPPVSDSGLQSELQVLDNLIQNYCTNGDIGSAERIAATEDSYLFGLKPQLTSAAEQARQTEATDIQKLNRLGPIPEINIDYTGSLDIKLNKPYRTGIVLTPYFTLSVDGTNYRGKPKDTEFGGKGIPDLYKAVLGFDVQLPLGRGKGVESADAAERSANIDYEASLSALTHSASTSVFNTAVAYWNLVAAQKTVAVFEQSLALQNQLVDLTKGLIDADELARSELAQTQARQADIQGQLEGAKRQLHQARVSLAQVIGYEIGDDTQIPLAADDFPVQPPDHDLAALLSSNLPQEAVGRRYDYKAYRQLQQSGKVLLKAAEIDLAPQVNLTLGASYSGQGEDANVITGLKEAMFSSWVGPSGKVGLTVDWPLANNAQLGKLAQQDAAYRQSAISTVDLARTIKSNVVLAEGQLREAVFQMKENAQAIELYRQTVNNEIEKLRLGSSTVIDTILTEQRLTDAMLSLVTSAQLYAELLAQLRYESGTLISEQEGGKLVSAQDLLTLPVAPAGVGQ